jgi:MoaE-MoaD fusion protein
MGFEHVPTIIKRGAGVGGGAAGVTAAFPSRARERGVPSGIPGATGARFGPSVTLREEMRVKVLFFGVLKDVTGVAEERLELPAGAGLGAVFEHYAARHPRLREMGRSIVMARNREFAAASAVVSEGDEIAFLPPVSGGRSEYVREIRDCGNLFALTRVAIRPRRIFNEVLRGDDGAVITFEGTVRNNTKGRRTRFLEYECYEPMAIRMMAGIGMELAGQYDIGHIAMVHRLGRMLIGETSVLIAVTAPHRKAAFDAAREGIDRLKRLVPIWKKEYFADGAIWVEGEWDSHVPVAQAG